MEERLNGITGRAQAVLESLDCQYAEVRFSSGMSTSIYFSGRELESIKSGDSTGGSVRVLKNGAWGFVAFNDPENIEGHIRNCLDLSSRINPGPHERSAVQPVPPVVLDFSDPCVTDFSKISIDEKFELIRGYNEILNSSPLIQTTGAQYRDARTLNFFMNTEGSRIRYEKMYCGVSLSSVAKDGPVIQPFHNSVSGHGGYEIVLCREETARDVARTAVDLLKAGPVPGGRYRVMVNQKLAGVFVHEAFGHLSEADAVYENDQMRKVMVLGRRFGTEKLNVIDDGGIPGLAGFIPADDEGILPGKTYLIKEGLLAGRLHSRETSFRMGEEPTGNSRAISSMREPIVRMTNTYIENGEFTRDDIFNAADDGIYALDFIGGQTNLEMFTFTSGYGYGIRNGKKGRMYRDIVLSGNVFTTLMNIGMIGNDRIMFGGLGGCGKGGQSPLPVSFGGPHMLINDVLIGGKQ